MHRVMGWVRQKRELGYCQIVGFFMLGGAFVLWIRPGSLTLTWIYQTYGLWLTTDMMAIALTINGWVLAWLTCPPTVLLGRLIIPSSAVFALLTSPVLVVGVTVAIYAALEPGVTGIFGYFTIFLWVFLQLAQFLWEGIERWIKKP